MHKPVIGMQAVNSLVKKAEPEAGSLKLFSCEKIRIEPGQKALVSSGMILQIPTGYYGQLFRKQKDLLLLGGVIDSDYRGDVRGILFNDSESSFQLEIGDYLCHVVFIKTLQCDTIQEEVLSTTERGSLGFGSTGY